MSAPIADGVLAATHKLVQQAMSGQWQDVSKTQAERRAMLDRLAAGASPQDNAWLNALRQAVAESDATVAQIQQAPAEATSDERRATSRSESGVAFGASTDSPDLLMDMIRGSR